MKRILFFAALFAALMAPASSDSSLSTDGFETSGITGQAIRNNANLLEKLIVFILMLH